MRKNRKHYTAEEKAGVLKRYLVEEVPLSELCDEYGLQPSQVYRWQAQLFPNAATVLRPIRKSAATISQSDAAHRTVHEKPQGKVSLENDLLR